MTIKYALINFFMNTYVELYKYTLDCDKYNIHWSFDSNQKFNKPIKRVERNCLLVTNVVVKKDDDYDYLCCILEFNEEPFHIMVKDI